MEYSGKHPSPLPRAVIDPRKGPATSPGLKSRPGWRGMAVVREVTVVPFPNLQNLIELFSRVLAKVVLRERGPTRGTGAIKRPGRLRGEAAAPGSLQKPGTAPPLERRKGLRLEEPAAAAGARPGGVTHSVRAR